MKSRCPNLLLVTIALLAGGIASQGETPKDQAWQILQKGVTDKSPAGRVMAVGALGLLVHNPQAAALAEKTLDDDKPEVRAAGAEALGRILFPASVPRLRKALSDKEDTVVMAAAHSLVLFKDPVGYGLCYTLLTGERKQGQPLISRGMEVLRDPKKVAHFSLEEGIGFLPYGGYGLSAVKLIREEQQGEPSTRALAARFIANDPDPQSGQALVRAISDKSWLVREAALEAIAERGDPSLLARIQPAMSDKKDRVRYTAAAVVIRLSDVGGAGAGRVPARQRLGAVGSGLAQP